MKITNKYLMFVGVTLLLASCELDKEMEGQYIGGEQNENIIAQRPNMTVAAVNGKTECICHSFYSRRTRP